MTDDRRIAGVERDHALILQAWLCILGDQRISYLSGPITTGPRWISAVERGGDRPNVIAENSAAILAAAGQLRARQSRLVVEPASLSVRDWSQDDYLKLWTTLIERHAAEVFFMPGWEYSIGCALEFERALLHDIPTHLVAGTALARETGIAALQAAVAELAKGGQAFPALSALRLRLEQVLDRLGSLRAPVHAAAR